MPIYKIRDTQTGEVWEELMSISKMDDLLEEQPWIELLPAAPMVTGTMGKNTPMKTKYKDATSISRPILDSTSVK